MANNWSARLCAAALLLITLAASGFSQTVKSLSLGSPTVTGGLPDTGTITLSTAAKSGGLKVSLKSNATYATVPASVTVLSGAKTATFAISTEVVYEKEFAFITASANGSSSAAELTLVPPMVNGLSITLTSVIGEQPATGTVSINVDAGASGFNVALTSSQNCASVPAAVKIPAGSTTVTFSITTFSVTQTTLVTLSASGGGATASATLTVLPGDGLEPSGWSKFLGNASNRPQGFAPHAAGKIAQTIDVFGGPGAKPAVGADGTVYVVEELHDNAHLTGVGKLRALTSTGATKWEITLAAVSDPFREAPLIGPNGNIYVSATEGSTYSVSPRGKLLWSRPSFWDPTMDAQGNLYTATPGGVSQITPAGAVKWTANVSGNDTPAVGLDGKIYVGVVAGVTAINPNGSIAWTKPVPWEPELGGGAVFACPDGSVCVWNANRDVNNNYVSQFEVANLTAAGAVQWSYHSFGNGNVCGYAANPKGGIDVFAEDGTLTSLSAKGTKNWTKSLVAPFDRWAGPPRSLLTVGSDGAVYVQDGNGKLWAFTSTGALKMSCQLGDGWCGAPALGPGGTVCVASFDESTSSASSNSLYQVTSGGALNWSLHGSFVSSVASFDVSGTAYFSGGCGITAVDASGNVKWTLGVAKHYLGNEFYWTYASQPAVANNGTIYFWSYDGLRAVSPAGKLKWFYPYTATTSTQEDLFTPAVGPDGTVYFADHNLYAVAPDGTLKWSKYYGDWLVAVCPAIAQDGTLYTITIGETGPQAILAINPDGSEKWSSTQAEPWKTITLDAKGNLYTIVFKQLASLTSSGAPGNSFGGTTDAWFVVAGDGTACYRDSTTNDIVINGGHSMGSDWEPFAMASDDTVYGITATGGALRAYNSEGVLLWSLPELAYWTSAAGSGLGFTAQNVIPSTDRPFSIALNGSLYVRTINGFVVVK